MNKETFNISKLSVDNTAKTLYAEFTETEVFDGGNILNNIVTKSGDKPVSQDMLTNLHLLVPHMLMICQVPEHRFYTVEYLKKKMVLEDAKIKGFFVSGISVSAKGMLSIIGGVKTKTGRVTSMVAPQVSLDLESSPYDHVKALAVIVENLFELAYGYFKEGNFGIAGQLNAFDQESEEQKKAAKA